MLTDSQRDLLVRILSQEHRRAQTDAHRQRIAQLTNDMMLDLEAAAPGTIARHRFYEQVVWDGVPPTREEPVTDTRGTKSFEPVREKVIYKYELNAGINKIDLPVGSTVLSVGQQRGGPYMWVLQYADSAKVEERVQRSFAVIMTGQVWDGQGKFLGTVHIETALMPIVLHIFEVDLIGG